MHSLDDLSNWELIPFPSPLHINLDYVYTVDVDAGTFRAMRWKGDGGILRPFTSQILLSSIDETDESIKGWEDWVVADASLHSDDELESNFKVLVTSNFRYRCWTLQWIELLNWALLKTGEFRNDLRYVTSS